MTQEIRTESWLPSHSGGFFCSGFAGIWILEVSNPKNGASNGIPASFRSLRVCGCESERMYSLLDHPMSRAVGRLPVGVIRMFVFV